MKERESLLPLLQLSVLEDEGREVAGTEPLPDVQVARQQMKGLLNESIARCPNRTVRCTSCAMWKICEAMRLREDWEFRGPP